MEIENQTKKVFDPRQDGTPILVAVGAEGFLKTSKDGKTWQSAGNFAKNVNLTAIAWSPILQRFVCLGTKTGQGISFISNDGETWEEYKSTSSYAHRIIWSDKFSSFIAVGQAGIIEISRDGMRWTRVQSPIGSTLSGLVWNEVTEEFVAVGAQAVLASKNSREWELVSDEFKYNLRDVAWSTPLNQYIAVTSTEKVFLSSPDARNWTVKNSSAIDRSSYTILWRDNLYNYFTTGLFSTICSSPDGEKWVKRNSTWGGLLRYIIRTIMWSEAFNRLFAADQNGYVYSSSSGVSWGYQLLEGNAIDGGRAINSIAEGWIANSALEH